MKKNIENTVIERIRKSRQYKIGTYSYFVWPYKGIYEMAPKELSYIATQLRTLIPQRTNVLFSFIGDGEILAVPLSIDLNVPLIIARDHHYRMQEYIRFRQKPLYFARNLYFSLPARSRTVGIIDAIISSGRTAIECILALRNKGIKVSGVIAVVSKPEYGGVDRIFEKTGIRARVLFNVTTKEGKLNVQKAEY